MVRTLHSRIHQLEFGFEQPKQFGTATLNQRTHKVFLERKP